MTGRAGTQPWNRPSGSAISMLSLASEPPWRRYRSASNASVSRVTPWATTRPPARSAAQQAVVDLSDALIAEVAEYLEMAPVAVYEVASFYNMYDLKPVGKYKLTVCTNLPCALSGAVTTADYLKQKLGISFGETTSDGRFTLVEGECMGACGSAPVMLVNNHKMCSFMNREAIDKKLAEFE